MQIGVITLFPHLLLCEDEETAEQMKKGYKKGGRRHLCSTTNHQIVVVGQYRYSRSWKLIKNVSVEIEATK